MAKQNIPQDEEIDLGSLFKIIGKGFSNLFNAIGKFFKGILHYFILLLLFLKNHALKLGLAVFVGAAIGLFLDLTKPKLYSSTMIVEPNFKSALQLYQNIDFYHELVKQKDSILLAETFQISVSEASKLKGFYIEPVRNENEKYEFFDDFIDEVDTTTVRNIDIEKFIKSFTDYDYKYHKIKVKSLSNTIFEKLNLPIINSIEKNQYFNNQKIINNQNLLQNEKVLLKSLQEVDTLRRIYNEVLIAEAKKTETGTNITLAEGAKKTDELELFNESLRLNRELVENNKEKAETTEIMNVVSAFNKVGIKERNIANKMTFVLGVVFGSIMLAFILFRQLNQVLLKYKQ
jgi:hypothetical protein